MEDSPHGKAKSKDMYWFAHGGEPLSDKNHQQRSDVDEEVGSPEQHNSPSWKPLQERKALPEEVRSVLIGKESAAAVLDGADNSLLLSHTERDGRVTVAPDFYGNDARMSGNSMRAVKNAEGEKLKKISDAEQDNSDAKAKKKVEREAALEARRNAQRSNVSFAFGSSLPRNLDLDVTTVYQGSDLDRNKRRTVQAAVSSQKPGPVVNIVPKTKKEGWADMHKSLFATFENTQSDKIYSWIPANQPQNSLVGSGAFVADDKMSQSMISPMSACRGRRKTDLTPTIPYDRTAPQRTPVPPASSGKRSVSMTRLDQLARPRRSYIEAQRDHAKANSTSSTSSVQKDIQNSPSRPRSSASEHSAGSNRPSTTPPVNVRARTTARKPRPVSIAGTMPDRKPTIEFKKDLSGHRTPEKKNEVPTTKRASTINKAKSPVLKNVYVDKPGQKTPIKHLTPKSSPVRKLPQKTKKSTTAVLSAPLEPVNSFVEEPLKVSASPPESPTGDEENGSIIPESGGKRIISEEEAKAALAEKRRLAREQAEKEAELERQHQEEQRRQEEERILKEEEEQRKMEEEQLRLLEEHRRHEEEKLRKAIEEQERKEQEEKLRREEEARLKAEQEKKAKEEAERQRIELEEKLRKEEEERAERKKRLEKIMSRTRGKGTSSVSSHSGGDQSDSADSQAGEAAEALSGNSSLNSVQSTDPSSGSASLEIHPESIQSSENESLNSMDMMVLSENSSLDSNLLMLPSDGPVSLDSDQASTLSNQNVSDEKVTNDVRNLSFDHISSTDMPVEPNMLFTASGDNPSSYSSESETINTDATTVVLTGERTKDDPPVASEIEDNLDCTSDKLLDFGTDSVQTLVSQTENAICTDSGDFSISDQLVVENFAINATPHDILKKPAVTDSEYFVAKSELDTPAHQEICAPEAQEFVENYNLATDPFTVASEMPVAEIACNKHSKDDHDSVVDSVDHKDASPSKKEVNVDNVELSIGEHMEPSENVYLNEENCGQNDYVETSVLAASKLSEEKLPPSPAPSEKNFNVPVQDDVNSTSEVFDKNSEQYVKSTDASWSLGLSNKIFDGSSEQFVENANLSQPLNFTGALCDGNSEQYIKSVDMAQSLDLVVNPFAGRKSVSSDDDNMISKEISSDLVKMDDSTGVITPVEDLEPHTIHTRVNLSDERFINASVTDSEDSSLDSNLSQVMNVNIIHNTTSQDTGALNSSPLDIASELSGKTSTLDLDASCMPFQKMPQYISSDYAPTTNGYQNHVTENFAYGNGIHDDCKASSITEDHHPLSSLIDNEINSNVISPINNHHVENILNTGDINFNKVPSNPFLATDDTSEVSENQFLNQGEIMRSPVQTEFHA